MGRAPRPRGSWPLADPSDEELLRRLRSRDRAAFAVLLDRHLAGVQAYAFRMTDNRADAEDIAQETFLRVWSRAKTFRPGRVRVSTWLYRIAHNLCVDAFRRRRDVVEDGLDTLADERFSGLSGSIAEERRAAVRAAVAELPERQRAALVLCQLQGWSNKDAAVVLEVSVDALESLVARARRTLRRRLETFREEPAEAGGRAG